MNKLFLVLVVTLIGPSSFAGQILCYNHFKDAVFDMMVDRDSRCWADVIWGSDNVCYVGDVQVVANFLAAGGLNSHSKGLKVSDVRVLEGEVIHYTGWDQRNFFSKESSLRLCTED